MQETRDNVLTRGDRGFKAFMAAGLLLVLGALFWLAPENIPLLSCAFHDLTGHSCPTCGLTRSLHAISHGELLVSLHYHLMGPLVFAGMLLVSLLWSVEAATGKKMRLTTSTGRTKYFVVAFAVLWITYWGLRLVSEFVR
jgi:hypothetical protein